MVLLKRWISMSRGPVLFLPQKREKEGAKDNRSKYKELSHAFHCSYVDTNFGRIVCFF